MTTTSEVAVRQPFIGRVTMLTIGLFLSAILVPSVASAQPADESAEISASRAFMTKFGISPSEQSALLSRALRGEPLLADVQGANPVSVRQQRDLGGSRSEIATFADGSINVTTYDLVRRQPGSSDRALSAATPAAVTGCSSSSGSGYVSYRNCKVHYRSIVFSYGFYANFTTTSYWDQIDSVWGYFLEYAIGHSEASNTLLIRNKTEDPGVPAHAELTIRFNVLPSFGQISKGVRLKVGSNTYWQENS